MGQVFHRNPKHKYPVAVGGDGPYVIDRDGKRYLDACAGARLLLRFERQAGKLRPVDQPISIIRRE